MTKMMNALYAESVSSFRMTQRPLPQPKHGEVLVKVKSCGICHTDVMIRAGKAGHVKYPFIPGHEFSGVITECGEGVKYLRPGQRGVIQQILNCGFCKPCKAGEPLCLCENFTELGCILDGGMAEYCVVPATHFLPIPDSMSFDEAACVEPLANACSAVRASRIRANDTVVIIGPGAIGILAANVARLSGAGKIILAGTRDARLSLAKESGFGVDETVNVRKDGAEDYLAETLLGGRGADVVIDAAGSLSALKLGFRILAPGGRLILEGTPFPEDVVPFNMFSLPNEASVKRVAGWSASDFLNAKTYIESKRIDVSPIITHRYPFSQWETGFDKAVHDKDSAIKVVLYQENEV